MANYITPKVRPILKWYGGKSFLARRIIELIPDSEIFVEPFAGGLNVLLNKCQCDVEIAGDVHAELIHLYETVRDHSSILLDRLNDIPYAEDVFQRVLAAGIVSDPVDRALHFLIKHRMSISGRGKVFSKNPVDSHDRSGWSNLAEELKFTAHRLQGVQFYNEPALNLIDRYDGPNVSFYLDPPYYPATRVVSQVYEYEMTALQHLFLLRRIVRCQGHVLISGYDNQVYNHELRGWEKYSFEMANHSSQAEVKEKKIEVVWMKPRGF